jgi:hypothetical protein
MARCVHIMVGAGHNNNHPSPNNPDPYMHILCLAMLHYSDPDIVGTTFAQSYSFKAKLKKFGKIGEKTAMTELTQLHDYITYHPVHVSSLSPKDCREALSSIMNIVKKQDGHVCCACACTEGSKEQLEPGYKKEDSASPMVATDSILISATINAHEGHNIALIDIPGAFLNAYNDKDMIMLLKRCLAELMVQVDPQLYCKYIIQDKKNQPHLYVKLTKAIYGLLKSALLFYQMCVDDLKSYSSLFVINPYNPCITNATVSNKKMITWHVDDLKVSHIKPSNHSRSLNLQLILPQ